MHLFYADRDPALPTIHPDFEAQSTCVLHKTSLILEIFYLFNSTKLVFLKNDKKVTFKYVSKDLFSQ
jgi:hypothetical protein